VSAVILDVSLAQRGVLFPLWSRVLEQQTVASVHRQEIGLSEVYGEILQMEECRLPSSMAMVGFGIGAIRSVDD